MRLYVMHFRDVIYNNVFNKFIKNILYITKKFINISKISLEKYFRTLFSHCNVEINFVMIFWLYHVCIYHPYVNVFLYCIICADGRLLLINRYRIL